MSDEPHGHRLGRAYMTDKARERADLLPVAMRNEEISEADVERLREAAKTVPGVVVRLRAERIRREIRRRARAERMDEELREVAGLEDES